MAQGPCRQVTGEFYSPGKGGAKFTSICGEPSLLSAKFGSSRPSCIRLGYYSGEAMPAKDLGWLTEKA